MISDELKDIVEKIKTQWIGYTGLDRKNKVCTIRENTWRKNYVKTSKKNLFKRI